MRKHSGWNSRRSLCPQVGKSIRHLYIRCTQKESWYIHVPCFLYIYVYVRVCVCMQALYKSDHEQSGYASHQTGTVSVVLAEWIISVEAEDNNATDANRPNLRNYCCLIYLICKGFQGCSVLCTFVFKLLCKPFCFRSEGLVILRSSSWINNKGAISAQLADFSLHLHRKTSCFLSHI